MTHKTETLITDNAGYSCLRRSGRYICTIEKGVNNNEAIGRKGAIENGGGEWQRETKKDTEAGQRLGGRLLPLRRQDVDVDQFVLIGGHNVVTGAVLWLGTRWLLGAVVGQRRDGGGGYDATRRRVRRYRWTGGGLGALFCCPSKRPSRRQAEVDFALMLRLMVQRREVLDVVLVVRCSAVAAVSATAGQLETIQHSSRTVGRSTATVTIASRLATATCAFQAENRLQRRAIQAWNGRRYSAGQHGGALATGRRRVAASGRCGRRRGRRCTVVAAAVMVHRRPRAEHVHQLHALRSIGGGVCGGGGGGRRPSGRRRCSARRTGHLELRALVRGFQRVHGVVVTGRRRDGRDVRSGRVRRGRNGHVRVHVDRDGGGSSRRGSLVGMAMVTAAAAAAVVVVGTATVVTD